jgi:hypothetical protein
MPKQKWANSLLKPSYNSPQLRLFQGSDLQKRMVLAQWSRRIFDVEMKLLGADVGFSSRRATTAIALLDGNQLHLARTGTAWERRVAQIPNDFRASVIAIDGPLLPRGADNHIHRVCEAAFIHSPFHNRCKPGLSHWGFGLQLRRASAEACAQFSQLLTSSLESDRNVHYDGPIVEAFPNAFLAVLIPEVELLSAPKLKRGGRFDWLYDQIATTGRLELILSKRLDTPDALWARLRAETDHELRAAFICLLTAAFAAQGTATIVGERTGGWFWLPSWSAWQDWAKQGLEGITDEMARKGYPLDEYR